MNRFCGGEIDLMVGPSVKFTAIWDRDKNSVLFYDSTGERLHRTNVSLVLE